MHMKRQMSKTKFQMAPLNNSSYLHLTSPSAMSHDKQTQTDDFKSQEPPAPISAPPIVLSNRKSLQIIEQQHLMEQVSSHSNSSKSAVQQLNQSRMPVRGIRGKSGKGKSDKQKKSNHHRVVQITDRRMNQEQRQILNKCLLWSRLMQPIAHDLLELGEKQAADNLFNLGYLEDDPMISQSVKSQKKSRLKIKSEDQANQQDVNLQQLKKEREKYCQEKREEWMKRSAFNLKFDQQNNVHFCDSNFSQDYAGADQEISQIFRY